MAVMIGWDAPSGVCIVCGQPVTRVADTVSDEWRWAGLDGKTAGDMPDLAHLDDRPATCWARRTRTTR